MIKEILAAVALLCLASSCTSTARQVDKKKSFPVVDGSRQAVIVGVDIIPRLKQLGYYRGPPHFLQHYIQKSTGRKLNVVREKDYKPLEMPYPIFVGNSARGRELFGEKLKAMDADSYIVHRSIRVHGHNLILPALILASIHIYPASLEQSSPDMSRFLYP